MKRILAAIAVIAVSSLASVASAADVEATVKGTVEVYGQAKVSVDMITTGTDTTAKNKNLTRVSSNSSRLGFKGTEVIDDDLSVIMQVELGIGYDGDSASPSYRNSFGGLSSKTFGTLIAGISDTPYKSSTGSLDAFGDTMGDYNAIIGNVNGSSDFDLRAKDTIMYTSPKFSGIQIMAQTSTVGQESDTKSPNGSAQENSFSVTYSNGPLYAALADETHSNHYGTLDSAHKKIEGTKLGVGYKIADTGTKIGLVYEMLKDSVSDSQNTRNAEYISVQQALGKETIKLAYGMADKGKKPGVDNGATLLAIGLDHSLSKRSTAYILYAQTTNNKQGTYGLGQSGAGGAYVPDAGKDPSVISIGLNHSF